MSTDLTGVGALAVLTAAMYLGGVAPAKKARAAAELERLELEQRLTELGEVESQVRDAKVMLSKVQAEMALKETRLERGVHVNTRVQRITALGVVAGLTFSAVTPGQEIAGKRFNRVPIRLSGSGTYPTFANFAADLHAQYRDVQIVGFRLTGRPTEPEVPVAFDADLAWYTAADNAASAGFDARSGRTGGAGLIPAATPPNP
jgi:Tfp pilus assembly protein PilO